jgi:hypothetical protein
MMAQKGTDSHAAGCDRERFEKENRQTMGRTVMRKILLMSLLAMTALVIPPAAMCQMGRGIPGMKGVLTLAEGTGAEYEMTTRDSSKQRLEIAITGTEQVEGKTAYWMEYSMPDQKPQPGSVKVLVGLNGDQSMATRMVMRMGSEVIEMNMNLPMMKGQNSSPADARHDAENLGTESITVPAGTFVCEHWRSRDGSGEYWISDKVRPLGLVKSVSKDSSMLLVRVFTGATTKLPPPYKKFDPMEMMGQQQHVHP